MNCPDTFQIALSYATEEGWIARDIHELLTGYGLSVYCYECAPDETHGVLRANLQSIYSNSWVNILLWSHAYSSKPRESFVSMERRFIVHRHVHLGEAETLILLTTDDTPIAADLNIVLAHDVRKVGLLAVERLALARLTALSRRPTMHGIVCHPPTTSSFRTRPRDCRFSINAGFKTDPLGRWDRNADVWVNFANAHGTKYVFLIPSALCTTYLRHTSRFRTEPRFLLAKRIATERFTLAVGNRELDGHWFLEKMAEQDVVAMYCGEYDRFLNEHFEECLCQAEQATRLSAPKNAAPS